GRLVYTPPANTLGITNFTFQVQDTGGTANGGLDLDPAPRTMTLQVIRSIGEHFGGTDGTWFGLEDASYTISQSNFGFVSFDEPPTNLRAVKITTLPARGTLVENGVPVVVGQFISTADIGAGNLKYI